MRASLKSAAKWLLAIAVLLLMVWLIIASWVLVRGPTAAQQQAMAFLEAPPAAPGEDGFAALWLFHRDVPKAQWPAVAATDVQAFASHFASDQAHESWQAPSERFASLVHDDLASDDWCRPFDELPCLEKVQANRSSVQAAVQTHAALLNNLLALNDYAFVSQPLEWRLETPFPQYAYLSRPYTAFAVQYLNGDETAAMTNLCHYAGTMQRLLQGNDSTLVSQMISAAHVRQSAQLLGDMLAHTPQEPIPVACQETFAPDPSPAQTLCDVARGEYQFTLGVLHRTPVVWPWTDTFFWSKSLLLPAWDHQEVSQWLTATRWGKWCAAESFTAFEAAYFDGFNDSIDTAWQAECALTPRACVWRRAWSNANLYAEYVKRLHDREAMRRAMQTVLWLHEASLSNEARSEATLSERFAQRPPTLHMDGHAYSVLQSEGKAWLRVELLYTERGEALLLPVQPH